MNRSFKAEVKRSDKMIVSSSFFGKLSSTIHYYVERETLRNSNIHVVSMLLTDGLEK